MDSRPLFAEHRIRSGQGNIYVRDHAGDAPAFVLMHGLPDNLRIYDELIPHLVAAGRRVVTFDFLGYGASDKPTGAVYSYAQQMEDLTRVMDELALGPAILVPHDSSGFAATNFAIDHPERVAGLYMLNCAYADASGVLWPEIIELAATPALRALSNALLQNRAQFGWMLNWQQAMFRAALPPDQQAHFETAIGKVIEDNFVIQPGAGQAYAQMTAQFLDEIARNVARLPRLAALDLPVRLIWGQFDPYLGVAMAQARLRHLRRGSLHLVPAGHWLQSDQPALTAKELLA
jgi:haloalkane dehalogenase